jgi:histidine triad (HIT) family protein
MMSDCIFCKIVKGELPLAKLYEDDDILAFLDIGPIHKGHALVIPKEHHETILDIPDDLLKKQIVIVKKLTKAIKTAVKADGITIGQSNYKHGGQVVLHIHFHIMPRFKDDGLKLWPQGKYEDGEMDTYKKKIIEKLE